MLWSPGKVRVYVRHADGQERFAVDARCAIVAVPLGVLKAPPGEVGAIDFVPALKQKREALRGRGPRPPPERLTSTPDRQVLRSLNR